MNPKPSLSVLQRDLSSLKKFPFLLSITKRHLKIHKTGICKRLIGSVGKPPNTPTFSFLLHQAEIQDWEFFSVNFI
jgi:hypothetical protein